MIGMQIKFVGADDPGPVWPDITEDNLKSLSKLTRVVIIDKGMASGQPSVALVCEGDHGPVVAETSAKIFMMIAAAITGKYPNLMG